MAGKSVLLLGGGAYTGDAGNPLLANMSRSQIEKSLTEFMAGDNEFNVRVKKHLLARLKYATGNLLNSINWRAKVKISGTRNNFNIYIGVYLTDEKLIDALLSGNELKKYGEHIIPSINKLVQYVEAKRSYYSEMLNAGKQGMLHEYRKRMVTKNISPTNNDPVIELARTIRNAMQKRVKSGNAPTLGSEYMFLGYTRVKQNGKPAYIPKYKIFTTPLYTIDSEGGEINQAIALCLKRYWDMFFDKDVMRAVSNDLNRGNLIDSLAAIFPAYIDDKNLANKLTQMSDKLSSMMSDLDKRRKFPGQYNWAAKNLVDKMSNIAKVRIKREIEYMPANQANIKKAMTDAINEIEKYSMSLRKRAAKRR